MICDLTSGTHLDLNEFTISPQGIRYKIITPSDKQKPQSGDIVTVHYTGWLLQNMDQVGQKFDSSFDRKETFQFTLGGRYVIEGWELTIADMHVGEERLIILPPQLAYGNRAISIIPANSYLIFDIQCISAE